MKEIGEIKSNIYKIASVTDRGQRLNKLISPIYKDKANEMDELMDEYDEEQRQLTHDSGPGKDDTIH